MNPRRKRTVRDSENESRLTDRDREIVGSVAKLRFATTSQLAALHFHRSRSPTNKRLRRLFDRGLLRAWLRTLNSDNLYSVTRQGLAVLGSERHDHPTAPTRIDGTLEHLLLINEVRIRFALTLPDPLTISWWFSDWELRRHGQSRLIPDALFELATDETASCFALEVDHLTRSPHRLLRKLMAYHALASSQRGLYGVTRFRTLVVGRDQKWSEYYQRSLVHAPDTWCTTIEDLQTFGASEEIWTSRSNPNDRVSLHFLATTNTEELSDPQDRNSMST